MRKILTPLFIGFLLCCNAIVAYSQTLVNTAWLDTIGHPLQTIPYQALRADGAGNIYVGGSTYTTGQAVATILAKYDNSGNLIWQVVSNDTITAAYVTVDMQLWNNDLYVTGTKYDSVTSKSSMFLLKYDATTGSFIWNAAYSGSNYGYDIAASVNLDACGNVFIAGTDQKSATESQMVVIKYDSSGTQQWVGTYDTTNMFTGATAMKIGMGGLLGCSQPPGTVAATGFSGTGFGSWSFVTVRFNYTTGATGIKTWVSNGNGSFSSPAGLGRDTSDHIYIAGTATNSGTNTDIKVIAYDTASAEIWLKTWGNADSLADSASRMVMDASNNILITGYTTASNGAKQMLVLKYSSTDSLLFSRVLSAPNPAYDCIGNDITADDSLNVYVTGKVFNGANWDMITTAFNRNGNTLWQKTYDGGGNDAGNNIVVDSAGDVTTAGTNVLGGTPRYITSQYQQLPIATVVIMDTDSVPLYIDNELIIQFNPAIVNKAVVNNKDWEYGKLSGLIPDSVILTMARKLSIDSGSMQSALVKKIFMRMTTADSISITRLGDTIKMPPFWSTYTIDLPESPEGLVRSTLNLNKAIDSLLTMPQYFNTVEHNYLAQLDNVPNDTYIQDGYEAALITNSTYPNANINVDPAWDIETGKNYVKVGVYDAMIDWANEDFGDGTFAGSKIVGGWDFYNNVSASSSSNPNNSHGTGCAGIIGALRNNGKGIAGIAGGDVASGNTGCQLFSIGVLNGPDNNTSSVSYNTLMSAIVEGSAYNPSTGYGYGLNIENNSYGGSQPSAVLSKAVMTCFQNQCLFVAARGNDGNENPHYPATYNNLWLMNVGASGTDGTYKTTSNGDAHDGSTAAWASSWGANVDMVAPGVTELVTTLQNPNYPEPFTCVNATGTSKYTCFNGTSSATPHVCGVAALMMSRHNLNQGYFNNLAPDDVKFLLDQYATDISGSSNIGAIDYPVGYDAFNGWGRLNAGAAMAAINAPQYSVYHSGAPLTNTQSTIATGITLIYNPEFGPSTTYTGDVFLVTQTYSNTFSSTTQILHYWPRYSSNIGIAAGSVSGTTILGDPDGNYSFLISGNAAYVTAQTECCHFTADANGNPVDIWVPDMPANLKTAYSLHLYDPDATSITETNSVSNCKIYPNPSQNILYASIVLPSAGDVKIQITDVAGHIIDVQNLSGSNRYFANFNTSNLAAGMYFCNVQSNTGLQVQKFVKN